MQNTWWIGRSCKRREAFRRAVLIGRALAPILTSRKGGAWNGWILRFGRHAASPWFRHAGESALHERDHRGGDHPIPFRTRQLSPPSPKVLYCSARLREDRASRLCRALPHGRGALAQLGERMAGSHEVRVPTPRLHHLSRGARRRRRAPFFCFPGRKRRTSRGAIVLGRCGRLAYARPPS